MAESNRRTLRDRKIKEFCTLPPLELSKPKKSRNEVNHDYYANIKKDPTKYANLLNKQKQTSKKNRQEIMADPVKKADSNAKAAERMRQYRARKKEKDALQEKVVKVITRKEAELVEKRKAEKREKDRLRKQEERKKWSHQKKKAESIKASKRYFTKKGGNDNMDKITSEINVAESETNVAESEIKQSKAAQYKAVSRAKACLPKNPTSRRRILLALCKKYGINTWEPVPLHRKDRNLTKELMKKLQVVQNKDEFKRMFSFSSSRISYWKKKKLEKLVSNKEKAVTDYYKENCRIIPDKRGERTILEAPIEELYKNFCSTSNVKISRSYFYKHRPAPVKKMQEMKFNQSLCEVCENFRLTCKSLSSHDAMFLRSKHGIINNFLCPKSGVYHAPKCIDRTCNNCKDLDLGMMADKVEKRVKTEQWLLKETEKGVKRKMLEQQETTVAQCLNDFKRQMTIMPKHLFTAQWQYSKFLHQKKNVRPGQLVTVMDFAENYRCINQDEVQAAYWHYEQATVHPMINYYHCSQCDEGVVSATVVAISEDLLHDSHAVEKFYSDNISYIQQSTGLNFQELLQWSDGCGVQYKSKQPFASLQGAPKNLNVASVTRNFYGSRHGKNPSDGVSANIKNKATRAVKCRRAKIQHARDLYEFLEANMTKPVSCLTHTSRHFIYVDKKGISRRPLPCSTLKGTRSLHCAVAKDGQKIWYRNLTCCCEGCQVDGDCQNSLYVKEWKSTNMLLSNTQTAHAIDLDANDMVNEDTNIEPPSSSSENFNNELTHTVQAIGHDANDMVCKDTNIEPPSSSSKKLNDELNTHAVQAIDHDAEDDMATNQDAKLQALSDSTLEFLEDLNMEINHEADNKNLSSNLDANLQVLSNSTLEALEDLNMFCPVATVDMSSGDDKSKDTNGDGEHMGTIASNGDGDEHMGTSTVQPKDTNNELEEPLHAGSYVMGLFPTKKETKKFLGIILQVDGSEAQVKYARRQRDYFYWPKEDDISWMPLYSLVPLKAPTMDPRFKMYLSHDAMTLFENC